MEDVPQLWVTHVYQDPGSSAVNISTRSWDSEVENYNIASPESCSF